MLPISDKHDELIASGTLDLGPPVEPEEQLPDGGFKQVFQLGAIYYHPRVGSAFEVHGLILDEYTTLGEQSSGLGYPTSDEEDDPNVLLGRLSEFEDGQLNFDPGIGVTATYRTPELMLAQVVVKIDDAITLPLNQGEQLGLRDLAVAVGFSPDDPRVAAVENFLAGLVVKRLFDDLTVAEMEELVAAAQQHDPSYEAQKFENSLIIDCGDDIDVNGLAEALFLWDSVEYAYPQIEPVDAAVVATGNPLFVGQGYLGAAPQGVSARAAWSKQADGAGISFIDLQQGWLLTHCDLPQGIPLVAGVNSALSHDHGAATLGIVVGRDNNIGICGLAPEAFARVISYHVPDTSQGDKRSQKMLASRVLNAASILQRGDVLLLEAQVRDPDPAKKRMLPAETDPEVFKSIRVATAKGIIVVEPAANFRTNLDFVADRNGRFALNRDNAADFRESGAIMVGACTSDVRHSEWTEFIFVGGELREAGTSFGSRIDCCAWGQNILTTGNQIAKHARDRYWDGPFFGGTSGAAAIVAGVCLLVQHLWGLRGEPVPLDSFGMRAMICNSQNGTPVTEGIKAMPDLAKIIANENL